MQLDLSDSEVEVIGRVLRNYLGDLRMEIRDTENHDFREGLKQDEQAINSFLARLPAITPPNAERGRSDDAHAWATGTEHVPVPSNPFAI